MTKFWDWWDFDQRDWGSVKEYPDDPNFKPRYVVPHWGGNTSDINGYDAETSRLRSWQNYHINSKGWRDIAYNFAIGDTGAIYRLRGYNPGGHTSGANDRTPEGDSYNNASLGVVWIGGANASGPSVAAREAMAYLIQATGIESVKGHRTVKQENGSSTACPGDKWLDWIAEGSWIMPEDIPFEDEVSEWAKAAWLKAHAEGLLTESSQPQSNVDVERLMVFLDRAGLLG